MSMRGSRRSESLFGQYLEEHIVKHGKDELEGCRHGPRRAGALPGLWL